MQTLRTAAALAISSMSAPVGMAITFGFAIPPLAQAADTPPPITRVTVYPGSAMVERVAQVSPGMGELVIAGLPANFDTATVRVQASSGVQVGQIVTRDVRRDEAASPREAALEEKILALSDQKDVLNVDAQSARLVQQYLEKAPAGGERGTVVDGKGMASVLDAVKRGAHDSFSQQQRIQVQVRELDRKIAVLRSELDSVRSGARDQRSVTIAVAAQRAGTVTLSYQVNRAGWKPAYRASLQSGASTVELERMATVSQKTGEDWRGVELKLSTGQPRLSARAPDPQPRLLVYQKPGEGQNVIAYASNVKASASLMRAPAPAPPAPPAPAADGYLPPVIETQGNFDTEFDVPGKASLPSDGREVSLALSRLALPAKQRIRIAPRIEQAGVLTAEVERPAGVWLGGDIQLFRDGSFVGSTRWNSGAKDKLSLPFGRDEQIRVSVDRAGQQSGNTGFIAQRGEHQVADVFTIRSYHKQPVDVLVLESSPVSTSSDVAVQATYAPQPGIGNWEQRQGVVGWEKTLAPNEAMKIDVRYKIGYPKEGWVDNLP